MDKSVRCIYSNYYYYYYYHHHHHYTLKAQNILNAQLE